MAVWLVTGGSGFLGRHLLAALARQATADIRVVAIGRHCPARWPSENFLPVDMFDLERLRTNVAELRPSLVFHAAGRTPPAGIPQLYRGNTTATVNLVESLRYWGGPTRLVALGSAAELGPVPIADLPVGESYPCRPVDAYGLSKWFAGAACRAARPPVEAIVARVFNPIGPGLPLSQAFGRFASRLAEPGPDPVRLRVGDLDAHRDFLDARDVARALIALAGRGRPGLVYHVGTGRSRRVGEGLEHLIRLSGRAVVLQGGSIASGRGGGGPSDSRADIRRIVQHTGWTPRISWEQSLADLWDEARGRSRLPLTAASAPV